MAMLKTLVRKAGGCKNIQRYLERKDRSLAVDANGVSDTGAWADEFDDMRMYHGKDAGRKYYHFVISPDPKDKASLEEVRALATRWARERYPHGQWVIEYHDDGANGGVHAHVVLNAVVPEDGRKVQMSNADVEADAVCLQRLCREMGLTYYTDDKGRLNPGKGGAVMVGRPSKEVADVEVPGTSLVANKWKDEVRAMVDEAIGATSTWDGFRRYLNGFGYDVLSTRRGVTFVHPHTFGEGGSHFKVRATRDNLGADYTFEAVAARLFANGRTDRKAALCAAVPETATARRAPGASSAVRLSAWEIRLAKDGRRSWKRDVREAVDACRSRARSMDEFVGLMEEMGYGVDLTRRGVTFVHPDENPDTGKRYRVRGADETLGAAYTKAAIMADIARNGERPYQGTLDPENIRVILPARTMSVAMARKQRRYGRWSAEEVRRAVTLAARMDLTSRADMERAIEGTRQEIAELSLRVKELEGRAYGINEAASALVRLESAESADARDEATLTVRRYGFDPADAGSDLDRERDEVSSALLAVERRIEELRRRTNDIASAMATVEAMGCGMGSTDASRARESAMEDVMEDASLGMEERLAIYRKWRDLPFEEGRLARTFSREATEAFIQEQLVRSGRFARTPPVKGTPATGARDEAARRAEDAYREQRQQEAQEEARTERARSHQETMRR